MGLGGSAAAVVLGAALAAALYDDPIPSAALARIVTGLEGHPDNALPALVGGIVVAAQPRDGDPTYIRLKPPPSLRAIVAIPDLRLATAEARALLPDRYARTDAVFNIQRAALLAAAFATGDLGALRIAMGDRIHQPYRASALPGVAAALAIDLPGLRGIALSGAGPSVLALADGELDAIAAAMRDAFAQHGVACETIVLALSESGVELREAGARGE
jgi:homoserine kinase